MESKIKNCDESEEVKMFLEKISLHSAMKGYDGQKAAQYLASKLEGRAFDICMRLSSEDKKDEEKIKAELRNSSGIRNSSVAIRIGNKRFMQ